MQQHRTWNTSKQRLSQCGSQTRSISIFWELVKNANYQAHPNLLNQMLWGWGPGICVLASSLGESELLLQRVLKYLTLGHQWACLNALSGGDRMLEGWLPSRVVCCHCLVINDMRKVCFYTFCAWCCYRQAFNFWRWLWFLLLVMTNSRKQNAINPCFQGYLLAADNRQEIKTIRDSVLFLLATDGSFQICWSKT